MATCTVKKWDRNFIGSSGGNIPTSFSTKMYSFGGDLVEKKLVKVALTLNWSKSIQFSVTVKYRTDINSTYSIWNSVNSDETFDEVGLPNDDGITSSSGGYTFILPYGASGSSPVKFHNIQFEMHIIIGENTTGNVAINDITFLTMKLRSYGSAE